MVPISNADKCKRYRPLGQAEHRKNDALRKQHKQHKRTQCVKSVCVRSYSGPYFPAFGLNTER